MLRCGQIICMTTQKMVARSPAMRPALLLFVGTLFSSTAIFTTSVRAAGYHKPSHESRNHGHTVRYHGHTVRHVNGNHSVRRRHNEQIGIASVYHVSFQGRIMADGGRFNIWSNSAASQSLPLGTVAMVTNLANGLSSRVEIRDRGPYVGHRVCDLSPGTAHRLGMQKPGLMHIKLTPLHAPL